MGCALMGLLNENWPLGLVFFFFFFFLGFWKKWEKLEGVLVGTKELTPSRSL